jgi:hypothetical protein
MTQEQEIEELEAQLKKVTDGIEILEDNINGLECELEDIYHKKHKITKRLIELGALPEPEQIILEYGFADAHFAEMLYPLVFEDIDGEGIFREIDHYEFVIEQEKLNAGEI